MARTRHSALDLLILWTAVPIVSGLDAVGGWNTAGTRLSALDLLILAALEYRVSKSDV